MKKISDSLKEIINSNALISYGLKKDILNLSKLAGLLQETLKKETRKEVSKQSIVMHLSRMQRNYHFLNTDTLFEVKGISIISGLQTASFKKTNTLSKILYKLKDTLEEKGAFFAINETVSEISIIYDANFADEIKTLELSTEYEKNNITGIKINFYKEDFNTPGLLSFFLDKLSIYGINIIEVSSSFTEIIFYIDKNNTRKAFDVLYS